MIKHYVIIKDNNDDICYLKYKKLEGFKFKPTNNSNFKHGVKLTTLTLYKPEFIELILKKKIKNKLVEYLKLILDDATSDGTDDAGYVRAVLNDVTRYRQMIINKYRRYLEEEYVTLLLEKITVLEEELKNKLVYLVYKEEEQEEKEIETRRRR